MCWSRDSSFDCIAVPACRENQAGPRIAELLLTAALAMALSVYAIRCEFAINRPYWLGRSKYQRSRLPKPLAPSGYHTLSNRILERPLRRR
jgi:hypothetical protein